MTMNYDKLDRETILYITQLEEEVKQLTFITNLNTKEISSLQKENQHLLKETRKLKNLLWWSQEDV